MPVSPVPKRTALRYYLMPGPHSEPPMVYKVLVRMRTQTRCLCCTQRSCFFIRSSPTPRPFCAHPCGADPSVLRAVGSPCVSASWRFPKAWSSVFSVMGRQVLKAGSLSGSVSPRMPRGWPRVCSHREAWWALSWGG